MRRRAFAWLALLASLVLVGCADEVAVVSDASCVMILEFYGRTLRRVEA